MQCTNELGAPSCSPFFPSSSSLLTFSGGLFFREIPFTFFEPCKEKIDK